MSATTNILIPFVMLMMGFCYNETGGVSQKRNAVEEMSLFFILFQWYSNV